MIDQNVLLLICVLGIIGMFIEATRIYHKLVFYEVVMCLCYKALSIVIVLYSAYYAINRIMDFFNIKIISFYTLC